MSVFVSEDGVVEGDGACMWEDYGGGTFAFTLDGEMTNVSTDVEGAVEVDGGEYGSVTKELEYGMHSAEATEFEWSFGWYDQTHAVSFVRD